MVGVKVLVLNWGEFGVIYINLRLLLNYSFTLYMLYVRDTTKIPGQVTLQHVLFTGLFCSNLKNVLKCRSGLNLNVLNASSSCTVKNYIKVT